ncbi:MAG TPA: hypothetical protein VHY20_08765, partial [Pirellulales bacterium]|nr:hypothetical protein [Pirellulales bacterium]
QLSGGNDAKSVDQYATVLAEQVARWPAAPSTDRARLWLGKLHESRRQWEQALGVYGAIGAASPSYAEAVAAISRCWPAWLDEQRAAGDNTAESARAAGDYFYSLAAPLGSLPQQFSPSQQAAALGAARIWLEQTDDHFIQAEQLLRALLATENSAAAAWQPDASALLALALAGEGRNREANELISKLPATGDLPTSLPVLIAGLVRLANAAAEPQRRELAELALAACENVSGRREGVGDVQRQATGLARGQALMALGRSAEARDYLASLARDYPRSQTVQQQYASALTDGEDATQLHAALDRWRLLEQANRPGTGAWFRAKYGLALAHYKLGNHERAARLIELTQVLHPELGGKALKAQFLELLERCRKP